MQRLQLVKKSFIIFPAIMFGPLGMDFYLPALQQIKNSLHTTDRYMQLTLGVYMLGIGVGQFFFGMIIDRFGRKSAIISGLAVYAIASMACAFSHNITELVLARFLQALGACVSSIAVAALIRDEYHDATSRANIYSFMSGFIGFIPVIAPIVGGYIIYFFHNWRMCFIVLTCLALAALVQIKFCIRETHTSSKRMLDTKIFNSYLMLLRDKPFLFYSWLAAASMSILFLFFSISPIIYIRLLKIPVEKFGFYFGINAIVLILIGFVTPFILSSLKLYRTLMLACVIKLIAGIIMLAWHVQASLSVSALLFPMLIASIAIGILNGVTLSSAMHHFPKIAGAAAALYMFIRFFVAFVFGEVIMQFSITSTSIFATVIIGVSCISILLMFLLKARIIYDS